MTGNIVFSRGGTGLTLDDLPVKIGRSFSGKDLFLTYHKVATLPDTNTLVELVSEIPNGASVLFFAAIGRNRNTGDLIQFPVVSRANAITARADYDAASRSLYIVTYDNKTPFIGEFYFVYEI